MRDLFRDRPNGYIESIKRGQAVMTSMGRWFMVKALFKK